MQMLLGFLPLILFVVVSNVSISLALWLSFAAAFAVGIRNFAHKREIRILDAATVILFGGLSLYSGFIQPDISPALLRLAVNGGLMLAMLYSLLIKQPFTLPYAKEQTPEPIWGLPIFLSVNTKISAAWATAFGIMAAADLASYAGHMSLPLDVAIGLLLLIAVIVFSVRYPVIVRKRFGLPG